MTILNTNRASDVLIQEINLSQVITSNSSAVGAQTIVSKQGGLGPKRFTNAQDYINEYGNPDPQVSFDVYCGLDFFREGSDLWALRVAGTGYKYSALLMYSDGMTTKLLPIKTGVVDPTFPDWNALVPAGGVPIALFYPNRGPGSYANVYSIGIVSNNIESPSSVTVQSSNSGGILVPGTYEYQVSAISPQGEALVSQPAQVVIAGSGVTNSVTITWPLVPGAIGYNIYGRTHTGIGLMAQVGGADAAFIDDGSITPDTTIKPVTSINDAPPPNNQFTVNIYDTTINNTTPVESFICTLTPVVDGSGADMELEARINPFSQYIQVTSNAPALDSFPTITTASATNFDGGDSGALPTKYQVANAWNTFLNKQLYQVNLFINGGHSTPEVQMAMDAVAQKRTDSVALLDVPSASQKFQQAIDYRNLTLNLNTTYSALFCPDVLEADNINGRQQFVPFSGWAAALCARTDRVANPSFSPAGLNRGLVQVLKSRYTYDDGQSSALFQAQINYTRTFIGQGIALWEQQTLAAQQSALSWLSVRRIVNVIKTSVYQFLLYSLQEPNDDFTGRQIVSSCSDYLETIKNARGISAYKVVSDASNNTAAMFNSGMRRVTIVIVPVIPIHIIDLQIVVSKQGVSFDEVLSVAASM